MGNILSTSLGFTGSIMGGLLQKIAVALAAAASLTNAIGLTGSALDRCKGYQAVNVRSGSSKLEATLKLKGRCGVYGKDLEELSLLVDYEDENRIHVLIQDAAKKRYQIPESVFPRPSSNNAKRTNLKFDLKKNPFSFSITRKSTGEKLFDTASYPLIFESQYLRLKTDLPKNPNLYGLGEHTDPFRLPTKNYTRTLWSRDSYGIPEETNLYGNHPVYYDHRKTGTHGVLMLNSNGMDIKLDSGWKSSTLEYNIIGGVLDLYFFEGPDPVDAAKEYAKIAGLPAMIPYWSLGFHQCRYGYRDWIDVAEVIQNHTDAGIPLETMWTDIDYMDRRRVFSNDPKRFPMHRLRQIVDGLHKRGQKYIVMVDPAVAVAEYDAFKKGEEMGAFLVEKNGELHKGVVWPGVSVYPDWFHPKIGEYWDGQIREFFDPDTGVDVDGLWIDMNEPASFCPYPCEDPEKEAEDQDMPPEPPAVRPDPNPALPGYPNVDSPKLRRDLTSFAPKGIKANLAHYELHKRQNQYEDLIDPPYKIDNEAGGLSDKTAHTDVVHANGLSEYDVHNLYGTMMSAQTREAMLARRPGVRPLIITRSTFAGAGRYVGKWLGDNLSSWDQYRKSIYGMLNFASLFQMPMVGSDVGGFGDDTNEKLLSRWATLGAFNPFFRNHNNIASIPQEFYRWPLSTSAAKKAIKMRYSLLDYYYTAFRRQTVDGTPSLSPLWFFYPKDQKTYDTQHQFFFGPSLMVTPVTADNGTDVSPYFPKGIWYDFSSGERFVTGGNTRKIRDVPFDEIPVFIRGGSVIAVRHSVDGPDTTEEVRKRDFDIIVAVDEKGRAKGELYLDDGESLVQKTETLISFSYADGKLVVKAEGKGGIENVKFAKVKVLGQKKEKGEKHVGLKVGEGAEVRV